MAFNFGKLAGNFIQGYDTTAQKQRELMEAKQKDAAQMYSGRMMALLNQQLASAPQGMTSLSTGGAPSPAMPQQGGVSPPAGGMSAPAVGAPGGAAGPSSPMGGAPNPQTRAVQQLGQGNAPQVPPSAVQQYSQQQGGPSSPLMSALSDPGMAQAVRLAQQAGVPPDMYGLVIPQFVSQFRPQANNAMRLDINALNNDTRRYGIDTQADTSRSNNERSNDTRRYGIDTQADTSRSNNERSNDTRRYGIDTQAATADRKLDAYTTKWSQDRDEKAREADARSKDRNRSIDERAKAAADAARYRAASLQEKAREADARSKDRNRSIDERAKAAADARDLKKAFLSEKTDMDFARQKDMLVKEAQAATNESGRNSRTDKTQAGATKRTAMQQEGANHRAGLKGKKGTVAGGTESVPPLVTTKEQFDALPSGAEFTEKDGNTYTKP